MKKEKKVLNIKIVEKQLNKSKETRFIVIDADTNKVLDNAQGWGYKTYENAEKAWYWGHKNKKYNLINSSKPLPGFKNQMSKPIKQNKVKEKPISYINKLNTEQKNALDKMLNGENIFLTGEAGTGKSFLTSAFIEALNKQERSFIITAPTGVAAINIGGTTLHKMFGLKTELYCNKEPKSVSEVVKSADVIIIDEISMCRIDIFEYVIKEIKLSEKLTKTKKQVVLIGDFFQLPPVVRSEEGKILKEVYPNSRKFFAFESSAWKEMNFQTIWLKDIIRQHDKDFIKELNKVRYGDLSGLNYFNKKYSSIKLPGGIILVGTNNVAKKINDEELLKIKTNEKTFVAEYVGDFKDSDCLADKELKLKVGARVMILVNDVKQRYQNGSFGTIVDFRNDGTIGVRLDDGNIVHIGRNSWTKNQYVLETLENGSTKINSEVIGECKQFPLKLAYAITMHKSQGQTFDKVNLYPRSFDVGQLYVALSRVRESNNLVLLAKIYSSDLQCDQAVIDFYNSLKPIA